MAVSASSTTTHAAATRRRWLKHHRARARIYLRLEGLEPPRACPPAPKADASTNSATAATSRPTDSRDRRSPTIAHPWGSGLIGKAPVSKTGDSRFESWLPRPSERRFFRSAIRVLGTCTECRRTAPNRRKPAHKTPDRPKTGPPGGPRFPVGALSEYESDKQHLRARHGPQTS